MLSVIILVLNVSFLSNGHAQEKNNNTITVPETLDETKSTEIIKAPDTWGKDNCLSN